MKKFYLMLSMLFAFGTAANAVPAKKLQKVITLANGAKVSVELRGDEYLSWWEGADGTAYRATADDAASIAVRHRAKSFLGIPGN